MKFIKRYLDTEVDSYGEAEIVVQREGE